MQHPPVAPVPSQSAPAQNPNLPSCVHAGGCLPGDPSRTPQGAHRGVGGHPGSCVLGWAPAPLPAAGDWHVGRLGGAEAPFHSAHPGGPVRTRWLRSYSAIFSISSFIFSMFCLRRSSHSCGTRWHMAVSKNPYDQLYRKDRAAQTPQGQTGDTRCLT